jgi:hypothetical protein
MPGIYFKGNNLQVDRAPEPTDIIWENCGFTRKEKFTKRALSGVVTLVLMIFALSLFVYI